MIEHISGMSNLEDSRIVMVAHFGTARASSHTSYLIQSVLQDSQIQFNCFRSLRYYDVAGVGALVQISEAFMVSLIAQKKSTFYT